MLNEEIEEIMTFSVEGFGIENKLVPVHRFRSQYVSSIIFMLDHKNIPENHVRVTIQKDNKENTIVFDTIDETPISARFFINKTSVDINNHYPVYFLGGLFDDSNIVITITPRLNKTALGIKTDVIHDMCEFLKLAVFTVPYKVVIYIGVKRD